MLHELHIKNLALIDEARIRFGEGFNVITGETGAGKTVVVGAVNLLLGVRADSSHIRKGCSKAEVIGIFLKTNSLNDLPEGLRDIIDGDENIIIRRVISADGKNKCYVNETAVTLGSLSEIGRRCIDLHGQHEHQSLFKIQTHVDFLDNYGGDNLLGLRSKFVDLNKHLKLLVSRRNKMENAERELLGRKDLLQFQINEIDAAGLTAGEDTELVKERDVLRNAEKIFKAISEAGTALSENEESNMNMEINRSATELVASAAGSLATVADYDSKLAILLQRLNGLMIELEDCASDLRCFVDEFNIEPGRLEEIEGRLAQISLMKRKYGSTIEEILEYRDRASEDLALCDTSGELMEELGKEIDAVISELTGTSIRQSTERKQVAEYFAEQVCKELAELNMPNARFEVSFTRDRVHEGLLIEGETFKVQSNGIDRVEFMVSANKGESLKQLVKVASGGEISRIMLAIKIVLADTDEVPTLIFDEIDTGIGGKTAGDIGRKMSVLAGKHQVLAVTHLPQIASYADKHITVLKRETGERTVTEVMKLDYSDKIKEVARLLSGNSESDVSLKHAEELLTEARDSKCRV
jgi:DNA repair protein RecN (Recombination protein N)